MTALRLDVYWPLPSPTLSLDPFVICVLRATVLVDMWFNGWLGLGRSAVVPLPKHRPESL